VSAELTGKVALVTGVGRAGQIGIAVARGLGLAGARVVICGRDAAALESHAQQLGGDGIDVRPAAADLTDPAAAGAAVAVATTAFGGLDGVAHLAGGLVNFGPIEAVDAAAFDAEIAANLKTAYVVARAAVPALRARGGGAIVNFASVAVFRPAARMASYSAAKAGVAGLTRALARELRDDRIRVNALAPGTVRTAQNVAEAGPAAKTRWVELDQIVAAVRYLMSDDAAAVTGQVLAVTAGDL
jgi:NAD(P)-dependent dehydrogenase (short-subunit alcohol dehydrogenase family)